MTKKCNDSKSKKHTTAGFIIREIERQSGTAYQVDIGQRNGKHIRKSYKTLGAAKDFAQRTRNEIEDIGRQAFELNSRQREDAVKAYRELEGSGASLADAVACYLKYNPIKTTRKTSLGYLAKAYLDDKRRRADKGDLRQATAKDAEKRLARFIRGNEKMQIVHLSAKDIDEWLDSQDLKPINRANYRRAISVFLNWCVAQEFVDVNAAKKTEKKRAAKHIPTLWTAKETAAIFAAAQGLDVAQRDSFVAYLGLIFFAGLRPTEAARLDWQQIDLDLGEIHIGPDVSKTHSGRIVHIENNLKAWLLKYRSSGKVWKYGRKTMIKCRKLVTDATGLKWRADAARHSYATYHLAKYDSIDKTVLELGHTSPVMLFKNYYGLAKNRDQQAEKFFKIAPGKAIVTAFKTAKNAMSATSQ